MLSISFLPWLLFLLGVLLSVPIVSYMENNRHKKAAAAEPAAADEAAADDEEGFGDDAADAFSSEDAAFGDGSGGQPIEGQMGDVDEFDEDAFK